MAGYSRQRAAQIVNNSLADADDVKAEFDQLQSAFNSSTGHKHDGTSGEGPPILVTGPAQDYVFSDTSLSPKATATYDLGTTALRYKDAYFSGAVTASTFTGTGVTQSNTDTTAGRLLKVGDFGLGIIGTPELDANAANAIGTMFLRGDGSATSPFGETQWQILNMSRDARRGFQLAGRNVGVSPRMAIRHAYDTETEIFSAWREVYHAGNILGTVSQSAGVPTGAIIQRGSNANGEFVRFADGTQICLLNRAEDGAEFSSNQGAFISPRFSYSYPATFSEAPSAQATHVRRGGDTGVIWASIDNPPSVSSIDIRANKASSGTHNVGFNIAVFGRWF